MESFGMLFEMLGINPDLVVPMGATIFATLALLRKKMPGNSMKGKVSMFVGIGLALAMSIRMLPIETGAGFYAYFTIIMTALAGWAFSMLGHEFIKGTPLEIPRNGKG